MLSKYLERERESSGVGNSGMPLATSNTRLGCRGLDSGLVPAAAVEVAAAAQLSSTGLSWLSRDAGEGKSKRGQVDPQFGARSGGCCGRRAGLSNSHCSMTYFTIPQSRWVSENGSGATQVSHCALTGNSEKGCRGHFAGAQVHPRMTLMRDTMIDILWDWKRSNTTLPPSAEIAPFEHPFVCAIAIHPLERLRQKGLWQEKKRETSFSTLTLRETGSLCRLCTIFNLVDSNDRIAHCVLSLARMSRPHESSTFMRKRVISTSLLWRFAVVAVALVTMWNVVQQIPTVQGQRAIVNLGKRLLGHRRSTASPIPQKQPPLKSSNYVQIQGENKWWWSFSSFHQSDESETTIVWIVTLVALVFGGGCMVQSTRNCRRRRRSGDYQYVDLHSTKEGECVCVVRRWPLGCC
jgi:hypothetical protein